jgi:capsular polysaccharide biosynthesis protein
MEEDQRSLQITGAFIRFLEKDEKSVIERFTCKELEANLSKHETEKGHPIYQAIEKRIAELREIERYKRETEQKWENRIIGFILGLIVALIIIVLRKYLFSS